MTNDQNATFSYLYPWIITLVGSVLLKCAVWFCVWLRQSWVKRLAQSAFLRVRSRYWTYTPFIVLYFSNVVLLKSAQFAMASSLLTVRQRHGDIKWKGMTHFNSTVWTQNIFLVSVSLVVIPASVMVHFTINWHKYFSKNLFITF